MARNRRLQGTASPVSMDGPPHGCADFTFYVPADAAGAAPLDQDASSWSGDLNIQRKGHQVHGRALVCKCFKGNGISITLRASDSTATDGKPWQDKKYTVSNSLNSSPFKASTERGEYLFSVALLCDVLFREAFWQVPTAGLLVVAGATGSVKSKVARGLVFKYLKSLLEQRRPSRRPHFVTCEDPIEEFFDEKGNCADEEFKDIDYTPRQIGIDVACLRKALRDALRQNPAVFYAGEIRNNKDWRHVLEFAGSGHLIIATAHAGSLVEAMDHIMMAVDADTPSRRGHVADRIVGVVHHKAFEIATEEKGQAMAKGVVPALWRHTPFGVKALTSEGLSSMLPHVPSENRERRISSLGRQWFAGELGKAPSDLQEDLLRRLIREALQSDLIGV